MSKADDRRKWQEDYLTPPNDRPNEPATLMPNKQECPTSRTGKHDFSMRINAPVGSNLILFSCWYCTKKSPNTEKKLAAWEASKTVDPNRKK